MKYIFLLLILTLHYLNLFSQYKVEVGYRTYEELNNPFILCEDSIGKNHFFTLDVPISILNEEIDSLFIINWSNIHLNLSNRDSFNSDLFVPFNTALRKKLNSTDSVGFSISYNITGEIGSRIIKVQWKDVKPKHTVAPNDVFNLQMIMDETDHSVSYHFGTMPPEFNTLFSLFGQGRQPALYFLDDFTSFSDTINEVFFISSSLSDENKIELAEFILLDGIFNDEQYSTHFLYYCPSIPLQSGVIFKLTPRGNPTNATSVENNLSELTFPNPAFSELYIKSKDTSNNRYEILNTAGLTEQRGNFENNTINIEQLSSGLHLLKWFNANGEVHINKFVKL